MKTKSMPLRDRFLHSLRIAEALKMLQPYTNALVRLSGMDAAFVLPVPFLRVGFSNAVLLKALQNDMCLQHFLLLALEKSVISGIFSSLIATPFFVLSLSQSIAAALVMFFAKKIFSQAVSTAGISVLGAAVSAAVQVFLSSLYFGGGVWAVLPLMLFFAIFSGLLTAGIAQEIALYDDKTDTLLADFSAKKYLARILCVIAFSALVLFGSKHLFVAFFVFLAVLALSIAKKQRIRIAPCVSIALFACVGAVWVPNGKVLFSLFSYPVTQNALILALKKTLSLLSIALFSRFVLEEKKRTDAQNLFLILKKEMRVSYSLIKI